MLVDGNWLINRAYSVFYQRRDCYDMTMSTVCNWVCTYAVNLNCYHLAFCIDGDRVFRYKIYPEYKANRRHKDKDVTPNNVQVDNPTSSNPAYNCLEELKSRLTKLGIYCQHVPELEADDLMASASSHLARLGNKVYVVTLDKDINQCISENVIKFMPAVGKGKVDRLLKLKDLESSELGLTGRGLVDYQTLIGDGVDGIPSVVGKETAKKILQEHKTLPRYLKSVEGERFWIKYQEELTRNQQLVKLKTDSWSPSLEELKVTPKHSNPRFAPDSWYSLLGLQKAESSKKKLFG